MGDQGILAIIGKFIYNVLFPLVPGAIGSALALNFLKDGINRSQIVISFFVGLACAGYGAPAVCDYFKIAGDHIPALIAFFIGLFGLAIVREIFKELNDARILSRIMDKFFGAKP